MGCAQLALAGGGLCGCRALAGLGQAADPQLQWACACPRREGPWCTQCRERAVGAGGREARRCRRERWERSVHVSARYERVSTSSDHENMGSGANPWVLPRVTPPLFYLTQKAIEHVAACTAATIAPVSATTIPL